MAADSAAAIPGEADSVRSVQGVLHNLILYVIDNEIHHRGQGYVYLRALGIGRRPSTIGADALARP